MFYNEKETIGACEDNPSLIFALIDEGHKELVDKILVKKIVSINETNDKGESVMQYLLKKNYYDLVEKHIKDKEWKVNHQNNEGDTFAHILVTKKHLDVMEIIKALQKNKKYIPNMRNNKGETILDKSMNNGYIYTTFKVLEDQRFNNIDLISLKNLYESYIRNNNYGAYSKVSNLEIIVDKLSDKELLPKVEQIVDTITKNLRSIKEEVINHKLSSLDSIIYGSI